MAASQVAPLSDEQVFGPKTVQVGLSDEQVFGPKYVPPSLPQGVVDTASRVTKDIESQAESGLSLLKSAGEDFKKSGYGVPFSKGIKGEVSREVHTGKALIEGLMGAGGYAASALTGAVQGVAGDPVNQLIGKISPLVGGTKSETKSWQEVADTLIQFGALGVDEGGAPKVAQDPAVLKEVLARKPEQVVKTAKEIDHGFSELAKSNPEKVESAAQSVEGTDPKLAEYLRNKIKPLEEKAAPEIEKAQKTQVGPPPALEEPDLKKVIKGVSPAEQTPNDFEQRAAKVREGIAEAKNEIDNGPKPAPVDEPAANSGQEITAKELINALHGNYTSPEAERAITKGFSGWLEKNRGTPAMYSLNELKERSAGVRAVDTGPKYTYRYQVDDGDKVRSFSNQLEAERFAKEVRGRLDGTVKQEEASRKDRGIPANMSVTEFNLRSSMPRPAYGGPEPVFPLSRDFARWHLNIEKDPELTSLIKSLAESGGSEDARSMLGKLAQHFPKDTPGELLLNKIMKVLPSDTKVSFVKGLTYRDHPVGGLYNPATGLIQVSLDPEVVRGFPNNTFRTLLHEYVHAVTSRYLDDNPNSELAQELRDLLAVARSRAINMYGKDKVVSIIRAYRTGELQQTAEARRFYGLTNEHEFLSEILSNQDFRNMLSESEKYAKPVLEKFSPKTQGSIVFKLLKGISKWLGLAPKEAKLLQHSMDVAGRIMDLNKSVRDTPTGRAFASLEDDTRIRVPKGQRGSIDPSIVTDPVEKLAGHLQVFFEDAIRTFNPEALGPAAKSAAASIGRELAVAAQKDSAMNTQSELRKSFWEDQGPAKGLDFLIRSERGEKFDDPQLDLASKAYKNWTQDLYNRDSKAGYTYDPIDNYIPHIFEKPEEVEAFFNRQYGSKWGDPSFIKDRSFNSIEQATKAGFKLKFTNPEDIMLAREHASNVAHAQANILSNLHDWGFAHAAEKGGSPPKDFVGVRWRSPTGKSYWVHTDAAQVMHNAFRTKSLWNDPRSLGKIYRGMMAVKNTIVPIKLMLTLFHPLHILTIDNAAGMSRAGELMAAGKMSPLEFIKNVSSEAIYKGVISNPKLGWRIMQAYKGKLDPASLTDEDKTALSYLADGGVTPEIPPQYRTRAQGALRQALRQRSLTTVWKAPLAAIDAIQGAMFRTWIPSLKVASYLHDVHAAIEMDPSLLENRQARMLRFRQIAKSVDNRYGEMAYNSLFWPKMVKDLAVANTLSLGWQMGFVREYGGSVMDIPKAVKTGSAAESSAAGLLHRPLFTTFYTTQALAYGGLLTYALSGQMPRSLLDYVDPWTGKKNANGDDERIGTPFYTREFEMIRRHIQDQGIAGGLGSLAASKSSGVVGLAADLWRGSNSFGEEFRNPDAPWYKRLEQDLEYTFSDMTPLLKKAVEHGGISRDTLGAFMPAPKYIEESPLESKISYLYNRYNRAKFTPYEQVQYSDQVRDLRKLWAEGKQKEYQEKFSDLARTGQLTEKDQHRLAKSIQSKESPTLYMFQHLEWQQQKKLLDTMTPDELKVYLPKSNLEHLRGKYKRDS